MKSTQLQWVDLELAEEPICFFYQSGELYKRMPAFFISLKLFLQGHRGVSPDRNDPIERGRKATEALDFFFEGSLCKGVLE